MCQTKKCEKPLKNVGLSLLPFDVNITQIHASTSTTSDDDIENFYEDLEQAKTHCRQHDPLIFMPDFNAKSRRRPWSGHQKHARKKN